MFRSNFFVLSGLNFGNWQMHREGRLDWKVDPKYDRIRVEAIAVPKLKVLWLASYKKRIPVVLFSNAVGRYHSQPSPERRNHLQSKGEWSWQKFPSLLPKVLRRLTTTESFNKVRRVDLMLSRRDLCSLQEQKRFFSSKEILFFYFQFQVFLTHMEIVRVKSPNSLHRLHIVGASVKVCEETSREKVGLSNKVFLSK